MDTVKFGRVKVKVGDCVSVPSTYFGDSFHRHLRNSGIQESCIYGRVEEIIDGNMKFKVKWDFDSQFTEMSLEKVTYESRDTPFQVPSIITKDDVVGFQEAMEQGSSTESAASHALLEEDFVTPDSDTVYVLFKQPGQKKIDCFMGKMIPVKPGVLVHNKKLLPSQRKFSIDKVLSTNWNGYDEDKHTVGSYVAWELDDTSVHNKKVDSKSNGPLNKASKNKKDSERLVRKACKRTKYVEESDDTSGDEDFTIEETVVKKKDNVKKKKPNAKQKDSKDKKKTKRKPRTGKHKIKVTVGKHAAEKMKKKRQSKGNIDEEEDLVLDYEDEEEEASLDQKDIEEKKEEMKKIWSIGGWNVDPRSESNIPGPHLLSPLADIFEDDSYIDYMLLMLPCDYIKDTSLVNTNKWAELHGVDPFTFDEYINILGVVYMMESVKLPERRMYWMKEARGLFPALNFGRVISLHRMEEFLNMWQLSEKEDMDDQIMDFIDAVNENLKTVMRAGETLCIDESMIKAYHRNLKGKKKIIRKPRPIGNELKTVSDAKTNIVLHMELNEAKEDMATKPYVAEFGATAACSVRITEPWKGSGRIVVGDSWFGSVKTCKQLWEKNGLYANMLVKTAHKDYPRFMLRDQKLERGQWASATTKVFGKEMMATRFIDLQEKMFISTCSTSLDGPPRKTKYHGDVTRPQVAFDYLKNCASIDVHNHFRTGSTGLEDAWQTKNPNLRQLAGILGFLFTNAYLAKRYFQKSGMKHCDFKIALANAMCKFKESTQRAKRLSIEIPAKPESALTDGKIHLPKLISETGRFQKNCFYCQHCPTKAPVISKTSYYCEGCAGPDGQSIFPLCHPDTGRDCMKLHIVNGMPKKRRYKGQL